jgi:hypothetical protein
MDGAEGAVLESGAETVDTGILADQSGETETQETEQVSDSLGAEQEVQATDGRGLPKNVQAALKSLKEQDPQAYKALRESYFSDRYFREQFKTPAEAKSFKLAVEAAGGPEAIVELQERSQWIDLVDQAAEQGNPSLIEDWAKDFPDGFKKVMPHAMRQFQKMDAEGFQKALQPHVNAYLDHAGMGNVFEELWNAVNGDQKDQAKGIIQRAYQWLEQQKSAAQKLSSSSEADPERERFESERQQFERQRDEAFRGDIGRQTFQHQQSEIEKALAPFLKTRKFSPEAKSRLVRIVNAEVNDTLKGDAAYKRQVGAFLSKKDAEGAIRYINGHLSGIVPEAVRNSWRALYGSAPARPASQSQAADQTASQTHTGGPLKLAKKPEKTDLEHGPKWLEAFIARKGIMAKGPHKGKLVTW